ncbi:diguanylate cyclase [Knoellia flava TL1]|uniref:Dinucleotide-binding protein n=2 Tax=Knoellia flava TaxID=913969 RepID=A0A8H9FTJ4_9MICO|nr:NADPH-dependent F420 reductase [Knoellia flava]KGN29528.1 diguanylate cyclase [Knoellia flava TL1]GGB75708.1 dinucleotide-binding protein [Knoellia flava]
MTSITIFGSGTMGTAIAGITGNGDNDVQVLGKADTDQAVTGDVVVLAVPYGEVAGIIEARRDQLAGKVVVDITNPVDFETFDSLTVPADSSAAAVIAEALPEAKVVKAFNTTFGGTLVAKEVGPLPTTVLVAGDDADAKALVTSVIESGGLTVIDAGALKRARELEALGFLQITLAAGEKVSWNGGFGVVR